CKMAIIDGKVAFNGGINIGYEYTGLKPDVGFWRDTHLQVVGEASADLQTVFDVHWEIAVPERIKSKTNLKTKSEVTKINSIGRVDHSKWSAEL
ncbi:cardiolipin synthase, partial [Escherichia coli]|nr:cardiolipin synthase [Escherichia coli]